MKRVFAAVVLAGLCSAAQAQSKDMSFFVTSAGPGKGADLGGVKGADQHCQALAKAAGGYTFEDAAKESPDTKNFHSKDGVLTFAIVTHTAGNGFFELVE